MKDNTVEQFKVFNTLSRKVEPLAPLRAGELGVYCCGPTVYDYQHIGNFKTFLFEDLLIRALRFSGLNVRHVMNITDVGHLVGDGDDGEDKMALAARREKKKSMEIAEYYTSAFFRDWDRLNLQRPDVVCKASDHIQEMIDLIRRIEGNGFTYVAGGNVYFDTTKIQNYGFLARLKVEQQKMGARVEVDANKRSPHDFVLWFTKSKFENQELQWDSPWGRGYPGWHIECSAMSMKYLGEHFDIHCGGVDHIPVHHTNEIAQSEAAIGKPWVSVWMHSEFILMNAEKMSKSRGRFLTLDDLGQEGYSPMVFRLVCLTSHYRAQLNFTWDLLKNTKTIFEKLFNQVLALKSAAPSGPTGDKLSEMGEKHLKTFKSAIFDDLNTPLAMASVWAVLADKTLNTGEKLQLLYRMDAVLGLQFASWTEKKLEIPPEIQELVDLRAAARQAKNWVEADRLRAEIDRLGFTVLDMSGVQKVSIK